MNTITGNGYQLNVCDICGFIDESKLSIVIHECKDGVMRCKKCRQIAVYGITFYRDDDEFEAYKSGQGNQGRNL